MIVTFVIKCRFGNKVTTSIWKNLIWLSQYDDTFLFKCIFTYMVHLRENFQSKSILERFAIQCFQPNVVLSKFRNETISRTIGIQSTSTLLCSIHQTTRLENFHSNVYLSEEVFRVSQWNIPSHRVLVFGQRIDIDTITISVGQRSRCCSRSTASHCEDKKAYATVVHIQIVCFRLKMCVSRKQAY